MTHGPHGVHPTAGRRQVHTATRPRRSSSSCRPRPSSTIGDPPAAEQVKASTPTPKRPAPPTAATTGRAELTPAEKQLRRIPTAELAAELQRRGWIVVEP
ncbi:MAG: hypothetical protein R2710_01855 [Acidimicrobiales bacterium]